LKGTVALSVLGDMFHLLTSVHEFKEKKYAITEILDWKNKIHKKVSDYLLDIVWHNLPKVQHLYESVLDINFPENADKICRFVAIRHDLVHRNGRMKSGKSHILKFLEIEFLFEEVEKFVATINEQLTIMATRRHDAKGISTTCGGGSAAAV
jgi:hypothetical protein